ncbi:RagB/SusD family nutrient uptake outer membrane protein [uncultured Parabacteroides sp.]|uniref:RagB/SusD family nutrient uptake outer membrane protein n=1 Tax=uncultured Parabacteroides sp. TaxID=512312 RepID=UPI00261EFA90|nr:RagB/SusD family nutrient uptake outer membrane protein [uncultured Parabacteroides sp.]
MKKIFKYMIVGLVACTTLSSCLESSLDTNPTDSMSGSGLLANANAALVPLNGLYRSMYSAWSPTGNTHQCFGISAYNLMADVMGEDMIMSASGSGWFWYDCLYNVKSRYTTTTWRSYDLWNCYYTWISNANYILAAEETMAGTETEVNYIMGQAYAIRAYSYFMLAQSFARTYKGHESEPCCPLYTEPTVAGTEGKPRSTVQETYDQIVSDISKAVERLNGTTRKHISHIDYATALGLQARIALVMEDWATAKKASEDAIAASNCTIAKVSEFKGLNNVSAPNVMWGAEIISDQSGMYASLFSHMDATADKYGATARKQINKDLYGKIGTEDDRLAWWNPKDANNKEGGYQQEKFKFSDIQTWMGDYVWMRIEEMYLIAAEAECRLGNDAGAREYLMDLMSKRDASYSCAQKSGTSMGKLTTDYTGSLLEEIIIQRRIELWGEAGRIYDIRRLKQGFKRTAEMGWPTDALLVNRNANDPESYMWVLTIPQTEFDGNVNMDPEKDQNPVGDTK